MEPSSSPPPPLPGEGNCSTSGRKSGLVQKRQLRTAEAGGGVFGPERARRGQRRKRLQEQEPQWETQPRNRLEDEPPLTRAKVESKAHSSFVELRRMLVDGAAVAAYVREHHDTRLRDPRQLNGFLQAISKSSDSLFVSLCQQHKPEVQLLLVRMFEVYSSKNAKISPAAHEFLIRCEQNGVQKTVWAADLALSEDVAIAATTTTTTTTATSPSSPLHSLLPPREVLKRLAAIDPSGKLERMMEMCSSVTDLRACAEKLQAALTIATEAAGDTAFDYGVTCRLISKLASKARRTCDAALLADSSSPSLSTDDTEALNCMMGILLEVTGHTLSTRPPSSLQQPIAKLAHLSKWCESRGLLLDAAHAETVASLEMQATKDLKLQAAQLETVMRLKALPPGEEGPARELLEELWNNTEGHFEPHSMDVLSSIAVVASTSGFSDDIRAQVARRLLKTQQRHLSGCGMQLPRRALNFVNAEYSREKRESIKRMLAAQKDAPDGVE